MRDYILTQSIAHDSTFHFAKLRRIIRSWFVRRDLRTLEKFNDYMLSDVGMTRGDLRHLRGLPLDLDLGIEMDRLRETRFSRGVRGQ